MKKALGLVEACTLIQTQQMTPADSLSAAHHLADGLEPTLKAFTVRGTLPDLLAQSKPGPLMGIPVAVKDLFATDHFVTTNGSPIYHDSIPKEDAVIVKKVRALGGVIFGKTVTTEFAWRKPGPTTNPWNSQHTPGGSSSGSAAAVGSGIVPLALGSQTVGSIIRPAAYCGVVGYKASFGAVPRTGVHPVSRSLDHIGFFTRSVKDVVHAFNLLKNMDVSEQDAIVIPEVLLGPLKPLLNKTSPHIALLKTPFDDLLSSEQIETLKLTVEKFQSAGVIVEDLTLDQSYWDGIDAVHVLMACEAAIVHEHHLKHFSALVGADIKELVDKGNAHTANEYIKAKNLQTQLCASINTVFDRYDAILMSPAAGAAPQGLAFTGNPIFCALWSLLGTPAITLPVQLSQLGLPLGIQLIGRYREDHKLLNIAAFAEQCIQNTLNYSAQQDLKK